MVSADMLTEGTPVTASHLQIWTNALSFSFRTEVQREALQILTWNGDDCWGAGGEGTAASEDWSAMFFQFRDKIGSLQIKNNVLEAASQGNRIQFIQAVK